MSNHVIRALVLLALFSAPVHAYVGPGLAASTLGVILGILGSVLIAVFAIFWYPIKRTFKGLFQRSDDSADAEDVEKPEDNTAKQQGTEAETAK